MIAYEVEFGITGERFLFLKESAAEDKALELAENNDLSEEEADFEIIISEVEIIE